MRTRTLGKNGPEITVVGYGAWQAGGANWGDRAPDDDVIAAMHAAVDSGQTWIDTAEVYGKGRSEELVGRAIAGRRDDVLLFTKGGAGRRGLRDPAGRDPRSYPGVPSPPRHRPGRPLPGALARRG